MNEKDKSFYDNELIDYVDPNVLRNWINNTLIYVRAYKQLLEKKYVSKNGINVLELGAGSCVTSLKISQLPFIEKITCYDISKKRMEDWSLQANKFVNGNLSKLSFVEGDFSNVINFDDQSFDIIIFDAALHHTRSMWNTIQECSRLLKMGGIVIAQREAYLSTFFHNYKLRSLLLTEEVKNGVSENAYSKNQYKYYFKANGFKVKFIGVAENFIQKLLSFSNGFIFSKWILVAEK